MCDEGCDHSAETGTSCSYYDAPSPTPKPITYTARPTGAPHPAPTVSPPKKMKEIDDAFDRAGGMTLVGGAAGALVVGIGAIVYSYSGSAAAGSLKTTAVGPV